MSQEKLSMDTVMESPSKKSYLKIKEIINHWQQLFHQHTGWRAPVHRVACPQWTWPARVAVSAPSPSGSVVQLSIKVTLPRYSLEISEYQYVMFRKKPYSQSGLKNLIGLLFSVVYFASVWPESIGDD